MWKDKYRVGVKLIDEQHEELFKRLSDFIEVVQEKEEWDEKLDRIKETMVFMQEYVVFHFDEEELYMKEIDFPDAELHRGVHEKFKSEINDYIEIFEQGGFDEKKMQEFGAKLMTWLIMHVGQMDQKIGKYVSDISLTKN